MKKGNLSLKASVSYHSIMMLLTLPFVIMIISMITMMIAMIMMMIRTNRDGPWVNWRLAPRWLTAVALPSKSPSPSNYNTGPIARHAILADFLRLFFLENALTASSRICSGVAHHCTDESHNQAALTGCSILGGFLQTIFYQFDLQQT